MTASPDFVVAIPARYAASRLPGKPLRLLAGEPLVLHVARRALAAGAREVWVAADDPRIADAHYNLARLYQQSGDAQAALRHFSRFKALTRQR